MIRPFTAVCVLLAAGSGLYLYTEKHRTTLLDQQISQVIQHTQQIREHTAMLRAEWALLNQPDRLQSLAGRFLPGLHSMAPAQFVQMASLAQHLPEVAAPVVAAPVMAAQVVAPARASGMTVALAPQQVSARAPQQMSALAPREASTLAPQQVMARSMTDTVPAPEEPAAEVDQPRPQRVRALPRQAQVAGVTATPRHPAMRMQPSSRSISTVASGPAPARPTMARTMPASRMASYEGGAVHALLGGGSNAGVYPRPMPIASWHPLRPAAVLSAPAEGATAGGHSSLGFSHVALSAPVPVQDGE